METDAKTHSQTLDGARESYGRVEGRLEGPEEDRASTGTPTESTNLDPLESQRLNQPNNIQSLDIAL